eukprot:GILK01002129.1.p1 GENE.GILK01002129.1~~GILK01002129.1.p1  ORF type:complete len:381 (-),score=66.56 GILK01002129.1:141-1244(-)
MADKVIPARTSEEGKQLAFPSLQNDLIIRAAKGLPTERVPIWIMRQAGRYLPEFKELRAENEFFRVCRTPDLACEVTLQPLRRFPLDAAIIFSDILVIPQAMGLEVLMVPGKGPTFPSPLNTPEDLSRMNLTPNVDETLGYVFDALYLTRHRLEGKVPLIGFSGAPWTLMAYMIEGGGSKTWSKAKTWLYKWPEASHKLLQATTDVIVEYLIKQVHAGAQLLQLFDTFAGELSEAVFNTFALPYILQIGERVKAVHPDIPFIVFPKGAHFAMAAFESSSFDAVSLDWTMDPRKVRQQLPSKTLQGNMDPCVLYAPQAVIEAEVERMLASFGTQKYIANLGHGLHPDHPVEHVGAFIAAVQAKSRQPL